MGAAKILDLLVPSACVPKALTIETLTQFVHNFEMGAAKTFDLLVLSAYVPKALTLETLTQFVHNFEIGAAMNSVIVAPLASLAPLRIIHSVFGHETK